MGADPATHERSQSPLSPPFGECPGAGDLPERIAKLVHPTRGIKRGIIETDEQGKGGRDRDDTLIPVAIGEIREVHAVLTAIQEQVR